jgi:hypothetical protein
MEADANGFSRVLGSEAGVQQPIVPGENEWF